MANDHKLIGKDFTVPDIEAKVTGRAKYSEDFRADNMAFCKTLTSPIPHAKIRSIDTSAALKMPGVLGILTADDVPQFPPPAQGIFAKDETFYVGEPILAVAAESEEAAVDAIEAIKIDFQELPHVVDPLESLFPGRPQCALRRQCRGRADQAADRQMGRRGFRRCRRHQDAARPPGRGMGIWRPRCRLQESQGDHRGEFRLRHHVPQLHGAANRLLPIGRAANAFCMAPTRAILRPSPISPAISASSRISWCSSPNIAAAASAARSPAIPTWRSPP